MTIHAGRAYRDAFPTEFVTAGQDAFPVVRFLVNFTGEMQPQSGKLAVFGISCAKGHDICCRRCRY